MFVTVVTDGLQDSESIGVFANAHLAHHRPSQSHARRPLRARRESRDGDALPRRRLRAVRRSAVDDDLRRRRLGQHRLAAHARLRDHRQLTWCTSRRRRRFGPARTATTSLHTSSGDAQTRPLSTGLVAAFTPPEHVRNDEIGARTEWLDGRLRLNLTYFDMAYTDRQGPIQILDPTLADGVPHRAASTRGDVDLERLRARGADRGDRQLHDRFLGRAHRFDAQRPVREQRRLPGARARSRTAIRSAAAGRSRCSAAATSPFGLSYALHGPAADAQRRNHDPVLQPRHGRAQLARAAACSIRVTSCPTTRSLNGRVRYTSAERQLGAHGVRQQLDRRGLRRTSRRGSAARSGIRRRAFRRRGGAQRSALGVTRGRPREYGVTFQYNFGGGGGDCWALTVEW